MCIRDRATSQTPNVTLAFNHVMSRIRLEFQAGEGVDLADITCYLIGLKNNGCLLYTSPGHYVADLHTESY